MITSLVGNIVAVLRQEPIRIIATRSVYANMDIDERAHISDFLWRVGLGYLVLGVGLLGTIVLVMVLGHGRIVPGVLLGTLAGVIGRWYRPVQPLSMAPWVDVPPDKRPDRQVLADVIRQGRQRAVVVLSIAPVLIVVIAYLLISRSALDRVLLHVMSDAIFGFFLGLLCAFELAGAAECLRVRSALNSFD